jgi:SAM-dependent methyltransferase
MGEVDYSIDHEESRIIENLVFLYLGECRTTEHHVFIPRLDNSARLDETYDSIIITIWSLYMTHYSESFFSGQMGGSRESADRVIPLVMELMSPNSVVDVGCGVGTWLASFKDNGVSTVLGIDGEYVPNSLLQIPEEDFLSHNLTLPLNLDRRFDLACSLEVGEHLPSDSAKHYVELLTSLAPVVLFSAAIPFQVGNQHINERWTEYWADLFEKSGFLPVDCLRMRIWDDDGIEWFYRQNITFFVKEEEIGKFPKMEMYHRLIGPHFHSLVHPELLANWADPRRRPFLTTLIQLPKIFAHAVGRLFVRN